MASYLTNKAKVELCKGNIDWINDTIKVLLVSASYTPAQTHNFVSTPAANELTGTGYTRKTLAGKTVTQNDTRHLAVVDADDVTWTGINAGTIGAAVIYREVTTDADSPIICILDNDNLATSGADVTLSFNASNGIFTIG